jgi:hypothetical protein
MYRRTVFLAPTSAEVEAVIGEICTSMAPLAAARDLNFSYVGPQTRANGATLYKIAELLHDFADVDLVVDGFLPSWYLVITAALDELGIQIVEAIRSRVPMRTESELLEEAASKTRTPGSLMALGMGLNGVSSSEAERVLLDGLTSSDSETRYGAAAGASFLRSKELSLALGRAAEVEVDEGVARVMRAAQKICAVD